MTRTTFPVVLRPRGAQHQVRFFSLQQSHLYLILEYQKPLFFLELNPRRTGRVLTATCKLCIFCDQIKFHFLLPVVGIASRINFTDIFLIRDFKFSGLKIGIPFKTLHEVLHHRPEAQPQTYGPSRRYSRC